MEIKSKYEEIIDELNSQGKVSIIENDQKSNIIEQIENELEEYRFQNQKRIIESQEEISSVILTA